MKAQIRPIEKRDLSIRVNWINHPSVSSNMYFELPATLEKTQKWFETLKDRKDRIDLICQLENIAYIGMMGLTDVDFFNKHAELHIFINPEKQGLGFGKILTKWLVNFGFLAYNLNKVYLYTNKNNEQAHRLYLSVGFKEEGLLRMHKVKNGKFMDRYLMSILRNEWELLSWKESKINYLINV